MTITIFKMLKKTFLACLLLFSIYLLWVNINLYSYEFDRTEKTKDTRLQLNFLSKELKSNNLGARMQSIFPEGFVFTNALYGLAWCELGLADTSQATKDIALKEALFAYDEINSSEAKAIFSKSLVPEHGICYVGWNNYLLSKILLLDTAFDTSKKYLNIYNKQCEVITSALQNAKSPFLESYETQSWPADMCVAMASLSNYDRIFTPKYQPIISDWIAKVKAKLDPATKLVPHRTAHENGETIEGARGCSISLILRLLSEVDAAFAREQYGIYKKLFVSTTFGLPSINEYPKGKSGFGDIDSGPVIFGAGFAGTIVSIGTFSVFGDNSLSNNQFKAVSTFGMSYESDVSKKYVFGLLPIADAFIAWSRASGLDKVENNSANSENWRLKFHGFSVLLITFIVAMYYNKRIIKSLKKS
ncbi:MAG: hypothetical protein RL660_1702 [Bacteroidota bacterium]|jgi:hypothetical protein